MTERYWVSPAPFRAHLTYLCEQTNLPWQVIATAAGVPINTARTLLCGRQGRARKLYAPAAQTLLAANETKILVDSEVIVTPGKARTLVLDLLNNGWTISAIAAACRVDTNTLERLISGRAFGVRSQLLWFLTALAEEKDARAIARIAS
ncbi:MAG: hypothetical protein ACRDAX_03770 [Propionibacteriaceae bacterium]